MSKFYGKIGFAITTESTTDPGIWTEEIVERYYYGDFVKMARSLSNGQSINDNVTVSNEITIIADPFANENFCNIRYAEFMGAKWKINNVTVEYPRLRLSFGGVYNV